MPDTKAWYVRWLLPLCTLGLMAGILLGRAAEGLLPFGVALALSVLGLLLLRREGRCIAAALMAVSLGGLLGFRAYHPVLPEEQSGYITGTVIQAVSLREDRQVQTVLHNAALNGTPIGNGYWTFYLEEGEPLPEWLIPGETVAFSGRIYHPGGQENPGGFNFREYLLQQGVTVGIYGGKELTRLTDAPFSLQGTMARVRHDLTDYLLSLMGEEYGAYAAAMLLGNRELISDDDNEAFRQLGIAHILSVSGYHVGVLAALAALLMKPLRLPRICRALMTGVLLAAYCLLTGGDAPVIRAALLLLWREFTRLRHQQTLPLHMLSLTAAVQLLFSPALLTGASFQLTYCAMLGLLLISPALTPCRFRENRMPLSRTGRWLAQAVAAALGAQLGILLPQLYWFGELPLLGLALNLLLMACTGGLMALYWFTLAVLPIPGVRGVAAFAAAQATSGLLWGVRALGSLKGISLWVPRANLLTAIGWGMLMAALCTLLPRKHRVRLPLALAGAALLIISLIPVQHLSRETTYIQFSVGNADAAILQDREQVVVIDVGEDGQEVADYLHQRRQGIDMLLLTHLHTDHAGGLQALIEEDIPVKTCYLPVEAETFAIDPELLPMLDALQAAGTELRCLSRGDVIPLPSGQMTVLWPAAGLIPEGLDANHGSLALLAELRGVTMLLTGDLTGTYEGYAGMPADILKIAHHGSGESTTEDFLAAVDPQVLLLSNSLESRRARMDALAQDRTLFDTDAHGAITIRFTGEGAFEVTPFLSETVVPLAQAGTP